MILTIKARKTCFFFTLHFEIVHIHHFTFDEGEKIQGRIKGGELTVTGSSRSGVFFVVDGLFWSFFGMVEGERRGNTGGKFDDGEPRVV